MKITYWPIKKIQPYHRNARTIPQKAVDKVASSLHEYDWQQPIVADSDGVIICGHVRWLAAKKLGFKQVPVYQPTNLTPAQVRAYRLMDNRSHEETDWDHDLLAEEMCELRDLDMNLDLTGFDPQEIDSLLLDDDDDGANQVPPCPSAPSPIQATCGSVDHTGFCVPTLPPQRPLRSCWATKSHS